MIRLIDRMLNFFLGEVVEYGVVMSVSDVKKTVAFGQDYSLDMRLLAHHIAHAEGLHRVLQRMVY